MNTDVSIRYELLAQSDSMDTLLEMRFNCSDSASYQVIKLLNKGSAYAVSFQVFDGEVPNELFARSAPKTECEALLERLKHVSVPIGRLNPDFRLGGFTDLSIDCPLNCCRFRWGALPPGWESLQEFASAFANLVSNQFGCLLFV